MPRQPTEREKELTEIIRTCLRNNFLLYPNYEKIQHLTATIRNNQIFITYNPANKWPPFEETRFGLQVKGDICYITSLILKKELRKKGHGRQLAQAAEEFAKQTSCKRIIVSASGQSPGFYQQMGFTQISELEYEKLL